jgi:DNA-binding transcriptional ArsR family regulator
MTKASHLRNLRLLTNPRRLKIINFLSSKGTSGTTQIAKGLGLEQTSVSHHLKDLLALDFIRVERQGKRRFYTINKLPKVLMFLDFLKGMGDLAIENH